MEKDSTIYYIQHEWNRIPGTQNAPLSEKEGEIISQIEKVIESIVRSETNAREKLKEDNPVMLHDQIGRAYATLRHSYVLSSKEALNLLSLLRLGADLDIIPHCDRSLVDQLLLEIQPAHLQLEAARELSPEERDIMRAEITRMRLQFVAPPVNVLIANPNSSPPTGDPKESNDE